MRDKLFFPTLSIATVVVLAAITIAVGLSTTPGSANDNYDERLDDLETRVAALEEEVGIDDETSQASQTSQQNNVSNSTSQTSVSNSSNQGINSYSGSFTSTGNNSFEVELDHSGSYTLTANIDSPFVLQFIDANDNPVEAFSMKSDEAGTFNATAELEPGLYTLEVRADSIWNVTLTSTSE